MQRRSAADGRLFGLWVSEPGAAERVTIDFGRDGEMVYTIHGEDKVQKIFREFTTRDGVIVTNQSSERRSDETQYEFAADGKLILSYQGQIARFVRLE